MLYLKAIGGLCNRRPDTNSFSVVQEGDADFDKIACRFSPKSRNYYRQLNGAISIPERRNVSSY